MSTSANHKGEAHNSLLGPLQLERRQHYSDTAVIGGLGALVRRWAQQAAEEVTDQELKTALARLAQAAESYRRQGPAARQAFVAEAERLAGLVAKPPAPRRRPQPKPPSATGWDQPLSDLPGIGPARTRELAEAGLDTIGDLLQFLPSRYEDRRTPQMVRGLQHRQSVCLLLTAAAPGEVSRRGGQHLAVVPASDGADPIDLVWFNQPYRVNQVTPGTRLIVTGQVRLHKGRASLAVSEAEIISDDELHVRRIVPIYASPPFSQVAMRKLVRLALDTCQNYPEGRVPAGLVSRHGLAPLAEAFREVHFPADYERLRVARARLAYDELFFLQLRLAQRRQRAKTRAASCPLDPGECAQELAAVLPFSLTGAQRRVIGEAFDDLRRPEPANRLVHGDVGAGKTVVAAATLLAAVRAGKQAVIMAPTEILARQHQRTLEQLITPLGVTPALLVGSLPEAEKRDLRARAAAGELPLLVGTHALFQETVEFRDLAVAVIDEQHRFGVEQRARLLGKGLHPNTFIMSATPIPRTLALTAYGDFDVSVLDELPPGRRPVHTTLIGQKQLRQAYQLIFDAVDRGHQAYLVCPVIEAGEENYLAAAEETFNNLQQHVFPRLRLGLVHGKLQAQEREAIMQEFSAGKIDLLVATTVIEVGVDVPRATVMVVMNAERFGLAQLHQLRGRVARSPDPAYCVLVTGYDKPEVIDRLRVLEATSDGFLVAEEDLRRRGPGELAGLRQSGLPDPRMADLLADTPTLVLAREDAFALFARDPQLALPEHQELRALLAPAGDPPALIL